MQIIFTLFRVIFVCIYCLLHLLIWICSLMSMMNLQWILITLGMLSLALVFWMIILPTLKVFMTLLTITLEIIKAMMSPFQYLLRMHRRYRERRFQQMQMGL
ncbi:TPA_asm: P overlapped [Mentha alphacytorhabdovirus 1]|nr:TPA_asm: P overlapped [Mentha alphacytorhabdovirus 1]